MTKPRRSEQSAPPPAMNTDPKPERETGTEAEASRTGGQPNRPPTSGRAADKTLRRRRRRPGEQPPPPAAKPRPPKDEYYLGIAREVALRSTCYRRAIGAIIVRDDQIVSTGYVGAPRKTRDSLEHGFCLRDRLGVPHGQRYELCRSVHAEQNAIINAARAGVGLLHGDMYIFGSDPRDGRTIDAFPCFICKKMIINAGLRRVICSTAAGKPQVFSVDAWSREWRERDIIDDRHQYGKKD